MTEEQLIVVRLIFYVSEAINWCISVIGLDCFLDWTHLSGFPTLVLSFCL